MKALVRKKYGGADQLELVDIPKPKISGDQILIKVKYVTLNRTDIAFIKGSPAIIRLLLGFKTPKQTTLGTDFLGEVVEMGERVKENFLKEKYSKSFSEKFFLGDMVFGFDDLGIGSGSYAEYLALTINKRTPILKVPDEILNEVGGVGLLNALAGIEGGHYAYNFINKVNLRPEQRALVNGGTGSIGSALVQLLLARGVNVSAVVGAEGKSKVKDWNLEKVYDYQSEDFTQLAEKGSFDYIFDAVGKSSFFRCRHLLKKKGIYISSELGEKNENLWLPLVSKLSFNRKVVFPFPYDVKRTMRYLMPLLREKKFIPMLDRVCKLEQIEEIREVFDYVAAGKKLGNVVFEI